MSVLSRTVPDGQLISSNARVMVRLPPGLVQVHWPPWHQVYASPTCTANSPTLPSPSVFMSNLSVCDPLRSSGAGRASPNQFPLTGVCTSSPADPSVANPVDRSTAPPPPAL